eukprot:647687-Pelagomonas_calceolata.AAC.1
MAYKEMPVCVKVCLPEAQAAVYCKCCALTGQPIPVQNLLSSLYWLWEPRISFTYFAVPCSLSALSCVGSTSPWAGIGFNYNSSKLAWTDSVLLMPIPLLRWPDTAMSNPVAETKALLEKNFAAYKLAQAELSKGIQARTQLTSQFNENES